MRKRIRLWVLLGVLGWIVGLDVITLVFQIIGEDTARRWAMAAFHAALWTSPLYWAWLYLPAALASSAAAGYAASSVPVTGDGTDTRVVALIVLWVCLAGLTMAVPGESSRVRTWMLLGIAVCLTASIGFAFTL